MESTPRFRALLTVSVQFEDAGLHPVMLKNIELCGYKVPTPIQAYVLPSVFKNIDIIGIAQTGEESEINSMLLTNTDKTQDLARLLRS